MMRQNHRPSTRFTNLLPSMSTWLAAMTIFHREGTRWKGYKNTCQDRHELRGREVRFVKTSPHTHNRAVSPQVYREPHYLSSYTWLSWPTVALTGSTTSPRIDIIQPTFIADQSNMYCVSTGAEDTVIYLSNTKRESHQIRTQRRGKRVWYCSASV